MGIDVEKTMALLETELTMSGPVAAITRSLMEFTDSYYDRNKPYQLLLKVLAPIGFTEETLEKLIASGAVTFD